MYSVLDAQYTDFLKLCLEHPQLDCYDEPDKHPKDLDDREKVQQQVLYAMLIPMLEHAYLAYHGESAKEIPETTKAQWPGWVIYATNFMHRPAFLKVWKDLGPEFDQQFQTCLNSLDPAAKSEPRKPDPCAP